MNEAAPILSIDEFDLPPNEVRLFTTWLGSREGDAIHNIITHEIAKEMAGAVNADFNMATMPNYQEDKDRANLRIGKLRAFIEIFDELRTRKTFKKVTITPKTI